MARVYIGVGHGGSDPGACGLLIEKDVNLKMALACRDYLVKNGVKVYISRESDIDMSINKKTAEANLYNCDLALDMHANAGCGQGSEVWHHVYGGRSKILAQNILNHLVSLGFKNRGLKTKADNYGQDYFGFIRQTNMPAVITEPFFVDTQSDVNVATMEQIGVEIAKGVLDTLGINYNKEEVLEKSEKMQTVKDKLYYVQCGAFKDKSKAEKLVKALKADGFDAIIKNL